MNSLECLKRIHDESAELSTQLTFNKNNNRERNLVCLYGSLLELTGGLVKVIETKMGTTIPCVFRPLLEGYVDFRNLHADAAYIDNMHLAYHLGWLKVLEEARKGSNPFLESIAGNADVEERIASEKQAADELRAKGTKYLSILDRMKLAGMEDDYRSRYNFLCADTHNDVRALIGRHVQRTGDDFEIVFYKDVNEQKVAPYVISASEFLLDATDKIHDHFKSGQDEKIKALGIELIVARQKAADSIPDDVPGP